MKPQINQATVTVRRADNFISRLGGLLIRAPLQSGQGLLLVPCASVHTAFMRYAIDVVFLDRAGLVLKIAPHVRPWRMAACAGAHQTLELVAGDASHLRLAVGATVPSVTQEKSL
ncbi:DUF192 domain-containing protein [Rhodoferax ferrireducens]|uniref:DUF192 domain-containing protein n=1 Tax=Rhodoferax ferrireducens TaxID=192843 RepID=UPI001E37E100|nr:DUF192 domain-containing protein [Rhodoferax ferrireducens]